jgi:hypothetical protein
MKATDGNNFVNPARNVNLILAAKVWRKMAQSNIYPCFEYIVAKIDRRDQTLSKRLASRDTLHCLNSIVHPMLSQD